MKKNTSSPEVYFLSGASKAIPYSLFFHPRGSLALFAVMAVCIFWRAELSAEAASRAQFVTAALWSQGLWLILGLPIESLATRPPREVWMTARLRSKFSRGFKLAFIVLPLTLLSGFGSAVSLAHVIVATAIAIALIVGLSVTADWLSVKLYPYIFDHEIALPKASVSETDFRG